MTEPGFETVTNSELEELRVTVSEKRENPDMTIELRKLPGEMPAEPGAARELLDAFAKSVGFNEIGEGWAEVDRETAGRVLVHALSKSLAYGSGLMDAEAASGVAEKFIGSFGDNRRYFTNGDCVVGSVKDVAGKTRLGFTPITKHTFDTGLVIADSESIGIIWDWDED